MEEWQERISVNPAICHGKACIRETDIQAALAYAAELAREGIADLPLDHTV
jgi:uncharacterized protein (DUF433 family)